MSNTSNYNLFSQTIKEKYNTTYTETFNGIFYLLSQHQNRENHFHIKKEIYDLIRETNNLKLYNIEENKSFKAFRALRGEGSFPKTKIIKTPPVKYDDSDLIDLNTYIKRLYKLSDYNNLILNDYDENKVNVLIDLGIRILYYKNLLKDKIIHSNTNKEVKNKLYLKENIQLDEEKLFDNKHYFITPPAHRMNNRKDIDALDTLIKYIYDNTNYQKLVLISADNDWKEHCTKKWNIPSTEKYDRLKTRGATHRKEKNVLYKSKSKGKDLLKDYLYIQESNANYIHLWSFIQKHKNHLFNQYPFNEERILRVRYDTFHQFDTGALLLKQNKIINYET